ncbi:MAG: integrase arm-type DNA-binding domain-containing protein [Xanthobacteraceae bacterium]
MPKEVNRLSAVKVASTKKPGFYADGDGLYLQVTDSGSRSWVFRFKTCGRTRDMGLGSLNTVGLAEARGMAAECRRQRLQGIDPIEARKSGRAQAQLDAARSITFDNCRDKFIASHSAAWANDKHLKQWESTLKTYVTPVFGALPVQNVDVSLVLKVLEPIWTTKPETASRVRGRIERILDWAKARGFRQGENPARWRGHLDILLAPRGKVRRVRHHAALPYRELPGFLLKIRQRDAIAARALEFVILTAARTGEVLGARWDEIDLENKIWTVPANRMKAKREHRVPLSATALAIVKWLKVIQQNDFVFPGERRNRPLSNMSMLMMLRRIGREELTVHGFRSTFRDWAAEQTNFPREVAEAALAHVIADRTEAAYRRGDLFEKRRSLMAAWAAYCQMESSVDGAVIPMKGTKAS